MELLFESAVTHLKTIHGVSNEDKLVFYAAYKQATIGDCNTSEPSRFSVVDHAKWNAWNKLKGKTQTEARQQYVEQLQIVDPCGFQMSNENVDERKEISSHQVVGAGIAEPEPERELISSDDSIMKANKISEDTASENSLLNPEKTVEPLVESLKVNSEPPSSFLISMMICCGLIAIGILGFLVTTLSTQALMFLGLVGAGILGVIGVFASVLDEYGLIALYPALLQRILTERTMVEVILEGTIVKKLVDKYKEIYPIFFCKTPEDRLAALANMSEGTRQWMTTKGIINLLPEWQQRITLPGAEYNRQKLRLTDHKQAFRPAASEVKTIAPLKDKEEMLKVQVALANQFFYRNLLDRAAVYVDHKVNPQLCKSLSLALGCASLLQLRLSPAMRMSMINNFKRWLFTLSSSGAGLFAILAILHFKSRQRNKLSNSTK